MEGSKAKKHTIKVGGRDNTSTVGETVSFTAEIYGTAYFSGGKEAVDGWDSTYYRLPDGTFRVLLETSGMALLMPSDMLEAMRSGQKNHFSYGRYSLEELKAESRFQIGEGYERLREVRHETVRNRF